MTDPGVPDSISSEALRSLLRDKEHAFPEPANAPTYSFRGKSPGVLDLSIVIQSIIHASDGANLVQLQQGGLFLLHAIRKVLQDIIDNPVGPEGSSLDPATRAALLKTSREHLYRVEVAYSSLEAVAAPAFTTAINCLLRDRGGRPDARLVRQCLISDTVCDQLGLDQGRIAAYFDPLIRKLLGN